ncbi:MAG: sulfotransferase [Gemmatimonadota bacterium]|nr:sulfotransferase [Gemmatimonadota bacterium]
MSRLAAETSPTVLFIGGAGRSGSTLLEMMLGQVEGTFAAGEVTYLWERGLTENQLCGCGLPLRDCEFWERVVAATFDGGEVPTATLAAERRYLCSLGNTPRLAVPALRTPGFRKRLGAYREALVRLYRAIADETGADVVTDSSKYPPEALLLAGAEGIDLRIVHLVRDSQAVAHAWQRWKLRPEIHWKEEYMPRYPYPQTAVAWNVFNGLFERMRRRGTPTLRVRYEDMVRDPRAALEQVCEFMGKPEARLDFLEGRRFAIEPNHTCSGNPIRFEDGAVEIRSSDAWEREISGMQRRVVAAMTYPYRRRYGYTERTADGETEG